jgi:hypothetical protein
MNRLTEKKLSREILSKIRRRANLLTDAAYDRYVAMITADFRCGVISASEIETWSPPELARKS